MSGNYDVIIVGAGPGGLACAHELGKAGKNVLVLEKNETIGPKVCAGGLKNLDPEFALPEGGVRTFRRELYTTKYKSYELELIRPLRTISRQQLAQYQLGLLKGIDNVTVMPGTRAQEIVDGQIITPAGKFSCEWLVGADGSNSIVRRHLGLGGRPCIGIYYEIPEVRDRVIWHFNPEEFGAGYIWEFPHLDHTNIGIFFNPDFVSARKAKNALHTYLDSENIHYSSCKHHAAAISHCYRGSQFGNVFLIGDAAGLALRTNGAGISFAIISGREVARKIQDSKYTMPQLVEIVRYKNRQENLFSFIERIELIQRPAFRMLLNLMKKKWFQRRFGTY